MCPSKCWVCAENHAAAGELVREPVCDLPASVVEFGLSGTIPLASKSVAGRRPARELVADQLRTGLQPGSSYLDTSR